MKKRIISLSMAALLLLSVNASALAFQEEQSADIQYTPPIVNSDTYEVMDASTGQVYISQQSEKVKYPASITKILTLALTMEKADLDDIITVSSDAVNLEYGASHIALVPGEQITVRDAIMATALASANDAANCLAEYTAGSINAFVEQMNQKAAELGCVNTNFVNPNGLHNDNHYTTAHEMALITKYAISVPGVLDILGTDSYTMPPTNIKSEQRNFGTGQAMLVQSAFTYQGTLGGKTGWETESHHTMVTIAQRNGITLICVVMDSKQKYQKFNDTIALYDYCFNNFYMVSFPPEKLPDMNLPIYNGEKVVGALNITAPLCSFALHKSISIDNVEANYANIPQKVSVGDILDLKIHFTLNNNTTAMYNALPDIPLKTDGMQQALAAVNGGANGIPYTKPLPVWQKVLIGIACTLAVLLAIRWYNLTIRRIRHKALRRRHIKQLNAQRMYNAPRVFGSEKSTLQRVDEFANPKKQKAITYYPNNARRISPRNKQ